MQEYSVSLPRLDSATTWADEMHVTAFVTIRRADFTKSWSTRVIFRRTNAAPQVELLSVPDELPDAVLGAVLQEFHAFPGQWAYALCGRTEEVVSMRTLQTRHFIPAE